MGSHKIIIFTDGACSGNPGPGGWGAAIVSDQSHVTELGGFDPQTTNNRMEILAAIKALENVSSADSQIDLYTDSQYVINAITAWIPGWQSNGWKTTAGKDVANRDLWELLASTVATFKNDSICWRYVRGHAGVPGNERVDEIANNFSLGKQVDLYAGELDKYPVSILELPRIDSRQHSSKSKSKRSGKAYSYLSLVNHVVQRHKTWTACEARVKGRSGARFKKAMSPGDEEDILRGWGLDADALD